MKSFKYFLGLMLMLVLVTSCHEEFDQPPVYIPTADAVPNMTIAEFKAKHWQESANYVDTVTEDEVIHGWVTANDISNNIYKTVYISDGTAGLSLSISQNELYTKFRVGQEVVLPMKGHYVGKATGQLNVAAPYNYVSKNGDVTLECLNMSAAEMESLVQFNLMPDVSKVDTVDVEISEFQGKYDSETLRKYQGLLVRIRNVEFVEADGRTPYADDASSSTNRMIMDLGRNQLIVRNSRSADFATTPLPLGRYDVVGVLGYYQTNNSDWQFYLRTIEDVMGEGKKGTITYPYSVADAIEYQNIGDIGWTEGYIVGAVAPEKTTVSSNADIEWNAPTMLDNTIVIADDPNCKDYTKCIVVPLPQGSAFRTDANLVDNPHVYKAHIFVYGQPGTYMGTSGIIGNTGSEDDYLLDISFEKMQETFNNGTIPRNWTNVTVGGSTRWGIYSYSSGGKTITCAQIRYNSTPNQDAESWLITPRLNIKKAKSKIFNFTSEVNNMGNTPIEVYLLNSKDPVTATVKVKLNPILPSRPASNYSPWTSSGDINLADWSDGEYYIGFCYKATANATQTTWCIDDVTFGMGMVEVANRADFETMGVATGQYGTLTSEKGWVATNCCLFQGGAEEQNPTFPFIGTMTDNPNIYAKAPTLNGKTTGVGTIVSPVLKGGMKKLMFSYGAAMSDKVLSFRIDVKQNGSVVKSWTETRNNVTQKTAYNFSADCDIRGDFTIEITNLCPSNSKSNKDRVSIWNLVWEN